LKKIAALIAVVVLTILSGCAEPISSADFFTVDFEKGQTLRYEIVSNRHISIGWKQSEDERKRRPSKPENYYEFAKMVFSYKPIEVNPYGFTTIEAKCESAEVSRYSRRNKGGKGRDALQSVVGRTFTILVGPNGKLKDLADVERVARIGGKKAFRTRRNGGRVKEPDMVGDFIATQWFLWDSISSIDNPDRGVEPGQQWQSQLSVPLPMIVKQARNVTYSLDKVEETEQGRIAIIKSEYSYAPTIEGNWPIPYPDGSVRMSGTFGFLRDYKVLGLSGEGTEQFNITKGRTKSYHQKYTIQLEASMPISISAKPLIDIEQNLKMKLLKPAKPKGKN